LDVVLQFFPLVFITPC